MWELKALQTTSARWMSQPPTLWMSVCTSGSRQARSSASMQYSCTLAQHVADAAASRQGPRHGEFRPVPNGQLSPPQSNPPGGCPGRWRRQGSRAMGSGF